MAKFAVIKIKGNQYKVSEGDEILVDKVIGKPQPEILMVFDDKLFLGKPTVEKAKVELKVLEELVKGKKIHVRTFKAKARIRKHIGSRSQLTRLKIEKITI